VFDVEVQDEDVCKDGMNPVLQIDREGNRDACVSFNQTTSKEEARPFNCSDSYARAPVEGMVVQYGAQVVLQGPDRCRLRAALLSTEPAP
jgi:hypothetical protein